MNQNTPTREACWICGKLKGQPPERCNGHYDMPNDTVTRELAEKMTRSPYAPSTQRLARAHLESLDQLEVSAANMRTVQAYAESLESQLAEASETLKSSDRVNRRLTEQLAAPKTDRS